MSHIELVFVTQGTVLFLKFLYVHHNATTYVSHGRNAIRDESTSRWVGWTMPLSRDESFSVLEHASYLACRATPFTEHG